MRISYIVMNPFLIILLLLQEPTTVRIMTILLFMSNAQFTKGHVQRTGFSCLIYYDYLASG